ncbi:MAG: GNAT family N-acetyltransferase [Candidatus Latescibacteria bacterium]|nr:GNAT family N-acetyltransferase [Candidatus Latescibacterota bacterium]
MNWPLWVRKAKGLIVSQDPAPKPQLRMEYGRGKDPSKPQLPPGYQLRPFRSGDEEAWAQLLNANGELGQWDRQRIDGLLAGGLVPEAQFFVEWGGQLISCTGVFDRGEATPEPLWEIGWVANHPEHRGKKMGAVTTVAATIAARSMVPRTIYLLTDDFRIPAIKVYLQLGYEPDYSHSTFPQRWADIFAVLGPAYQVFNPQR